MTDIVTVCFDDDKGLFLIKSHKENKTVLSSNAFFALNEVEKIIAEFWWEEMKKYADSHK